MRLEFRHTKRKFKNTFLSEQTQTIRRLLRRRDRKQKINYNVEQKGNFTHHFANVYENKKE